MNGKDYKFEPIVRIGKGKDGRVLYYAGLMKMRLGEEPKYVFFSHFVTLDTALEVSISEAAKHNREGVDYYKAQYDGGVVNIETDTIQQIEEVDWYTNLKPIYDSV